MGIHKMLIKCVFWNLIICPVPPLCSRQVGWGRGHVIAGRSVWSAQLGRSTGCAAVRAPELENHHL